MRAMIAGKVAAQWQTMNVIPWQLLTKPEVNRLVSARVVSNMNSIKGLGTPGKGVNFSTDPDGL